MRFQQGESPRRGLHLACETSRRSIDSSNPGPGHVDDGAGVRTRDVLLLDLGSSLGAAPGRGRGVATLGVGADASHRASVQILDKEKTKTIQGSVSPHPQPALCQSHPAPSDTPSSLPSESYSPHGGCEPQFVR